MRVKRVIWLALLVALAAPRSASAGLLDYIWELSGPQLLGVGAQCERGLWPSQTLQCFFFVPNRTGREQHARQRIWLLVEPALYFSTGKNSTEGGHQFDFRFRRAEMAGIDPMVAYRVPGGLKPRFYVAAGFSLNRFFGPDVDDFFNWAYKLRPIAADLPLCRRFTLQLAYNLRFYPSGFAARDRSNGGAVLSKGHGLERVTGYSVALIF